MDDSATPAAGPPTGPVPGGLPRRRILTGMGLAALALGLPAVGAGRAGAATPGLAHAADSTDLRALAKTQGLAGFAPSATIHAEFEIRDWLRTGDASQAANARLRLLGVADAWNAAPAGKQAATLGLGNWTFMDQYPHYYGYSRLEQAGLLSAADQAYLAPLLVGHAPYTDVQMERGNNNRALQYAGDAAWYAQRNPNAPDAAKHLAYAEAVWSDYTGWGGAWEVMPSYNLILLTGLLDLAELLGRTDEVRSRYAHEFKRYFEQVSGNGVRSGESEAQASMVYNAGQDDAYAAWYNALEPAPWVDPWANWSFTRFVDVALRAEYVFEDPEYLWYARTQLANGDVPDARLRADAVAAIDERLHAFYPVVGPPATPSRTTHVSRMRLASQDPQIDRLLMTPTRSGPAPFAGFYLFDRNNGYMHTFPNQVGRLYEFSKDGSLLLRTGGKYSREPAFENIVMLTEPWKAFPLPVGSGSGTGVAPQQWQTATADLRASRTRWVPGSRYTINHLPGIGNMFATNPETFCYADGTDPLGFVWGNLDTYSARGDRDNAPNYPISFGLMPPGKAKLVNMDMNTTAVDLPPASGPMSVQIRNLRLVGPAGTLTLDPLTALGDAVEVDFYAGDWTRSTLTGSARNAAAHVVAPGVLELVLQPGTTVLTFPGLAPAYDVTKEYTRISLDYRYLGDTSEWRRLPISFGLGPDRGNGGLFGAEQAAILQDAEADQRGGDSFGSMRFSNVFTVGTAWTRRSVLTEEGVLVVCDEIVPDAGADGWNGGPVWHVGPDWKSPSGWKGPWNPGPAPQQGPNWFDAPAFNRAHWQSDPLRLLTYFHPQSGSRYGMQQHDQQWTSSYAISQSFAVTAERPSRFLTVFVPHDASADPSAAAAIAGAITTSLTPGGRAQVQYQGVTVQLNAAGEWAVHR